MKVYKFAAYCTGSGGIYNSVFFTAYPTLTDLLLLDWRTEWWLDVSEDEFDQILKDIVEEGKVFYNDFLTFDIREVAVVDNSKHVTKTEKLY